MAITHFLLESKFSSNSLLQQTKWSSAHKKNNALRSYSCKNVIRTSPKFRVDCLISTNRKPEEVKSINNLEKTFATAHTEGILWRSLKTVVKALQKPVVTFILFGFLFLCHYGHGYVALAASGGRMGGRSSSGRSSSSSGRSSSSSGRSSSSSGRSSSSSGRSRSLYFRDSKGRIQVNTERVEHLIGLMVLYVILRVICFFLEENETSVVKIQVGLMGTARSLQRELNKIAKTTDTSTPKGYRYILQESITAILLHPDYWISGYSSVNVKESLNEGEKFFDKLSVEERSKFYEETLVNVDNVIKQSPTSEGTDGIQNEYIVVTVIMVANGVHKLPPIGSSAELKKALEKLASIPSCNIMAGEVLWTPQQENDTLLEQKMLEDYPLLRPL